MIVDHTSYKTGVIYETHGKGMRYKVSIVRMVEPAINGYVEYIFFGSRSKKRSVRQTTYYYNIFGKPKTDFVEHQPGSGTNTDSIIMPAFDIKNHIECEISDRFDIPKLSYRPNNEIIYSDHFFMKVVMPISKKFQFFCIESEFEDINSEWKKLGLFNEYYWWFKDDLV